MWRKGLFSSRFNKLFPSAGHHARLWGMTQALSRLLEEREAHSELRNRNRKRGMRSIM